MSLDSTYEDIKKSLSDLYFYIQPSSSNIEEFTLMGPKPDIEFDTMYKNDPNIPVEIKQYNIIPSELYSVIDNFDLEPLKLSEIDKSLRIKYLNILLKIIDDYYTKINSYINTASLDKSSKDMLIANSEPSKNLTIRIIKLLIKEVNSEDITKSYTLSISFLSCLIILLILFIFKK